jgi:hypothetical protein
MVQILTNERGESRWRILRLGSIAEAELLRVLDAADVQG